VTHVLVARLDSDGDVLLAGPAIRAAARGGNRVTLLCGPRGRAAAALLPGVDEVAVFDCPWIDPEPAPVDAVTVAGLVDDLRGRGIDAALVLTSFHQTALPLALLLRLAGVPRIAAHSDDYPGSLLDIRHQEVGDVHEVERNLGLAATLGLCLPQGDDGHLAVKRRAALPSAVRGAGAYVVVHPGASVSARSWSPRRCTAAVEALRCGGWTVVVTGGPGERALTAMVAGPPRPGVIDLGGATSLTELAEVLAAACAVVVGNTGPAHLAAAVGTPVVCVFAPTVPATRWRPWRVPHVLLGDHDIACAGCRVRTCPVPGHPCIDGVTPLEVVRAVSALARRPRSASDAPSARLAALQELAR
jgi:ADP-heptose:LPS heptosyltransferase